MSSDHVHIWHIIKGNSVPDDPEQPWLVVERCSWCGETREYHESGNRDR